MTVYSDKISRPEGVSAFHEDDLHDPWQAAEQADVSGWLLGYSDMMTLLFACFAVLFAYQKAQYLVAAAPPSKAPVTRVAGKAEKPSAPAEQVRPTPQLKSAAMPVVKPASAPVPQAQPAQLASAAPAQQSAPSIAKPAESALSSALPVPILPNGVPAAPRASPTPDAAASMTPAAPPTARDQGQSWIAEAGDTTLSLPSAVRPAPGAKGLGDAVEVKGGQGVVRLEISDGLLFAPGSADLKPAATVVLDRVARWLGTQNGAIAVEGHTDDRPIATERYRSNWDLSAARASAVARSLIERGLAPDRLRAVGLADTQPRSENTTPEGRARNRRVSLVVNVAREREVDL